MSLASLGLAGCLAFAVVSAVAGMVLPARARAVVTGVALGLSGAAAVVCGIAAVTGDVVRLNLPNLLPLFGVQLAVDRFGGLFVAVTGAVMAMVGLYHVGYGRGHGRAVHVVLPLFGAAMILVPLAASVPTFLLCWELMAGTSLVLVLTEHRKRNEVRSAALWYAVLTHLGVLLILIGLVLLVIHTGPEFGQIRAGAAELSPALRSTVFVLTLAGFASKAGIVPLHAWLPRAHPEAPSHVSALMSAAMVNLGVYGVVRVGLDLLGGGTGWWWILVLVLGAVSAVYGILQAAMDSDLKRMLGWSTTENLGIVLVGLGAAGIFASADQPVVAGLALTAALLHVVNHAVFKSALFLSAGSVLHGTGTRDLDALGGLRFSMPATTVLFGAGALGASALPPGNAFVSEWLLLQSLVHGISRVEIGPAITVTIAVAAIALTAGLSVATFVKAFGVGFLARPRSADAERAHESPVSMLVPIGLLALGIGVLAIVPGLFLPALGSVATTVTDGRASGTAHGLVTLRLERFAGSMSPLLSTIGLLVAVVVVLLAARFMVGRRVRRAARLWDCGAGPMTARMEYTATSFAEPLQRVFDDVVEPEHDVDVTHVAESRYLVENIAYRRRVPDRIERRLYRPLIDLARRWGELGRRTANGSVHRYLAYGFFSLTGILVVLAVTR